MPNIVEELRLQCDETNIPILLPPRFPSSLPLHEDPEAYADSLERYKKAIEDLTLLEQDGVAVFKGGPMLYRGKKGELTAIEKAWITPMIVQDLAGFSAVHMITINGTELNGGEVAGDMQVITASDADLMLDNVNSPGVQQMRDFLNPNDPRPRTLMRVSTNGNTYYPYIMSPNELPEPAALAERLSRIERITGIPVPFTEENILEIVAHKRKPVGNYDGFVRLEANAIETPKGTLILQGMYNENDPWEYYEILSALPIDQFDPSRPLYMRIDSGCTTGQCYHEQGCDCRNQLYKAMEFVLKEQGMLLTCSSHDGRGNGIVAKLATEAAKQGIDIGYNKGQKLLTIPAAQLLLGDKFDVRTYEGAVQLIKAMQMNNKDIRLLTDNRLKFDALRAAGIDVQRVPTETADTATGSALANVLNKKEYAPIYFSSEE